MKKLYLTGFFLVLLAFGNAIAQTSLEGKVTDAETEEPILFGNVALFKNDVLITGTETDFDGNYSFPNIDPGTYAVEVSYVGYQTQRQTGVVVLAGKAVRLDFQLSSGLVLDEVVVTEYTVPLIEQDNTTSGGVVTQEKIRNLPTKNINALAATTAGLSSIDGGDIAIRGSRTNATDYYIDGIRISGSANLIPQSEIDQMQVITGGIEAQYGDVTGGIISITTLGPSNRFSGGLEYETSELTDAYGYNLLSANLSGPIFRNSEGLSVLGFRVSMQLLDQKEDAPRAFGRYRATEDVIREIEENPQTVLGGTLLNTAEFMEQNDVELLKARPNTRNTRLDLTAKLDARFSKAIDVSFSGSYNNTDDTFTPSEAWGLLNWQNNPINNSERYRGSVRFRHRIGGQRDLEPITGENATRGSLIRNVMYTLQFAYEKRYGSTEDVRHGDNFFRYGHVGDYNYAWTPAAGESQYSGGINGVAHAGYVQQFQGFTPGATNPVLANYNQGIEEITEFLTINGLRTGNVATTWSGIHQNVGSVYNLFSQNENDRYTFTANASFDLFPGSSDKGRHNIQFGVMYEQRINRDWRIAPFNLWGIARLRANNHILGIDTTNVIGTFKQFLPGLVPGVDSVEFDQFQTLINESLIDDPDVLFFKKVRELVGQQGFNQYVNVDGLNPDDLSLDMFSAQELNDQRIIDYFGYDYLGNKIDAGATFDDFFTETTVTGARAFTVAPFQPIYTAAYIQDKFTFKDIIFRLGLRVDRYDANTKVLRDPQTLYQIMTADDFYDGPASNEQRPLNVDDDFSVYVETEGSTSVKAFRDGDQWYFANGSPANDGNVIFGGEIVTPYYVEQDPVNRDIRSRNFNPDQSFVDYEPQVNWMPRLAFSFPISNEANFFAHYDILVQRPPSNAVATALDYYYFEDGSHPIFGGGVFNNPNLRPEKTIDYEVGFKQKLSTTSALSISAYYKELRDMIQARTILYVPAPINTYDTYDNLDFGTVKGFSLSYDLRRTGNIEMTASYTLQFADGTGSNANSQRGLTQRGNLRTIFPLTFDERHRIVANIDYRYASGKRYNGPRFFGVDIFANAGVGMQVTAVSGRPYTARQQPVRFGGTGISGSINGARLPWNFTVDLRADKSFRLTGPDAKVPLSLNVYLRVQNLLDTRNIIGVYSASGSAEDDGYLATAEGQSALDAVVQSGRELQFFLNSYQWRLLQPGFYTLPRRIYLGAIIEF